MAIIFSNSTAYPECSPLADETMPLPSAFAQPDDDEDEAEEVMDDEEEDLFDDGELDGIDEEDFDLEETEGEELTDVDDWEAGDDVEERVVEEDDDL